MRLRDEQLRAHVVYVDPEIETNAELDAITDKVVEELRALQQAGIDAKMPSDPRALEIDLIKSLRELLEKMVSSRREHFLRHKIQLIQRRIANLFFSSAVYTSQDEVFEVEFHDAEEALLAVLGLHRDALADDLTKLKFADSSHMGEALGSLARVEKQLATSILARSRPELERLLRVYRDALLVFLMKDFQGTLGDFAWEVVQASGVARGHELSYKIRESQFSAFRAAFETKFMERLLYSLQEPLQQRMHDTPDYDFRSRTLRFASDPRIYAEICAVMCNTIYDYLHGEGFLDLPVSWQKQLYEDAS